MQEEQLKQELQYNFPYHHVAQFRKGFKSTYYVRYGLKHITSLEWILQQIKDLSFHTLCDVGCGDGRLVAELNIDFPDKLICGVDYSERSIHLAKGINPDGDYRQFDILSKDPSSQFDLVTLIEVFEHIPVADCQRFATQLAKMVKPKGHLMVTVPHHNLPLSTKHFQHFTKDSLLDYFQSDFRVERVQFLEKKKDWRLYLYYRLLKNKLFLLNNKTLLQWIFNGYKRHHLLAADEDSCERIFVLLTKN